MALFDKLFPAKRKLEGVSKSRQGSSPEITLEQVRLLLFKECDYRGRKLLFDSSSIERVPAKHETKTPIQMSDTSSVIEISEGYAYVYKGTAQDVGLLGEMIFGAVAMNYRGVSLKIHIMDDPQRLMCTKVFCVPATRKLSKVDRKVSNGDQFQNRCSSSDLPSCSKPLNVPTNQRSGDMSLNSSFDRKDSGFYGEQSPHSSVSSTYDYFSMLGIWDGNNNNQEDFYSFHSPVGRRLSACSAGSWQRRSFHSVATRFPLTSGSNLLTVPTSATHVSCDSQIYSNSSASGTSESLSSTSTINVQKKIKLGLALLITVTDSIQLDLVQKCLEHSPQLQSLVCRLRLATLEAGTGSGFISTLYEAALAAARWLTDLVYGPRIEPAWLGLVTSSSAELHQFADTLVTDLCSVLSSADNKHTNFFVSTLLTHVLTYHLGWVTTVSPYDSFTETPQPEVEVHRPYNALWAQLGDLCGNIGFPPRAARTIIHGKNEKQFINKLLVVLSYFIRCGEVKRSKFEFEYNKAPEGSVVFVDSREKVKSPTLKRTATRACKLDDVMLDRSFSNVTSVETSCSDRTVVASEGNAHDFKINASLSNSVLKREDCSLVIDKPMTSHLRRTQTSMLPLKAPSDTSLSSDDTDTAKVLFVLGDDDKLVGLKNKSNGGKSVKRSSKTHSEPFTCDEGKEGCKRNESRCCKQQSQHSKPIKHSGFKFEFDKYPQIVTNYMKSKNLEILDRHYIGKPGNLKLDNFQFDPMVVPPLTEERCETCDKCQQLESTLQTPTNASELEYMNDIPRPQYATVVENKALDCEPKSFVRKRKENTVIVNVTKPSNENLEQAGAESQPSVSRIKESNAKEVPITLELPMPKCVEQPLLKCNVGFENSLLGGVCKNYVPDMILHGTLAEPKEWEKDLKRDLDVTTYLNKNTESPVQAVAIVGDTSKWEVSVKGCGRDCAGMSALVGGMLDALPHMRRASLPAAQCLSFIESKLRELCVLSKTLADMLMSPELCDMATLTKSLNIDINDVPLLLAVATTHTPQVATRYGISFR